jgi:hypothetical protein
MKLDQSGELGTNYLAILVFALVDIIIFYYLTKIIKYYYRNS